MLEFHTLDVFTETPYCGNPLAVVLGANDLTPAQMQRIAREFNLSETIFVQPPDNPTHTAKVRIFFPSGEIPFAGHPTIGCAIHLATQGRDGDFAVNLVLEEQAGLVPVTVKRTEGRVEAELTAPVLPVPAGDAPPTLLIAQALGIDAGEIGFGRHQPRVFQGGPSFLYVPVSGLDALSKASPREPAWSRLMDAAGVDSAYLYTPAEGCDFRARLFAPTVGIAEDPATGSASAILAAALHTAGAVPPGVSEYVLHQGIEMGRPSRIVLTIDAGPDGPRAVRIRGSAVLISSGRIRVPQD